MSQIAVRNNAPLLDSAATPGFVSSTSAPSSSSVGGLSSTASSRAFRFCLRGIAHPAPTPPPTHTLPHPHARAHTRTHSAVHPPFPAGLPRREGAKAQRGRPARRNPWLLNLNLVSSLDTPRGLLCNYG
eukprot:SAG31_NODE_6789_length_1887_cov_3.646532_4_plen_129_part_00